MCVCRRNSNENRPHSKKSKILPVDGSTTKKNGWKKQQQSINDATPESCDQENDKMCTALL